MIAYLFAQLPTPKAQVEITVVKTFDASWYDGIAYFSGSNYATTWAWSGGSAQFTNSYDYLGQRNDSAWYWIYRYATYFDTSSLPDGTTINSAILSFRLKYDNSTTDFDIVMQSGSYGTYPHVPLVGADYYKSYYSGNYGSMNTASVAIGYNNITLSDTSTISKTSWTKFMLRSSLDIAGTAPANTYDTVTVYDTEAGTAYSPKLYVNYTTTGYEYFVYGAYNEDGTQNYSGINATLYKSTESPETQTVNGSATFTSESLPTVFNFAIGYNESRVYYLMDSFEEIYAFYPTSPYYTYSFYVNDYVGVTNGYLESIINVNGTDRVVERWTLNIEGALPFILSFGHAYKFRVVCDQGTVDMGTYTAAGTTTFSLTIGEESFGWQNTGTENVTLTCTRPSVENITVTYVDQFEETNWVNYVIYEASATTTLVYESNVTGVSAQAFTATWTYGLQNMSYYVYAMANRLNGTATWQFALEAPVVNTSPWNLDILGTLPIPTNYLFGIAIILCMAAIFSKEDIIIGIIATYLTVLLMAWLNWFPMTAIWQVVTGVIAILLILTIGKQRESGWQ